MPKPVVQVGEDPDPAPYLFVTLEQKRIDQSKPYDGKKACWVPDEKEGYLLGEIKATKGDIVTVGLPGGEVCHSILDRTIFLFFFNIHTLPLWSNDTYDGKTALRETEISTKYQTLSESLKISWIFIVIIARKRYNFRFVSETTSSRIFQLRLPVGPKLRPREINNPSNMHTQFFYSRKELSLVPKECLDFGTFVANWCNFRLDRNNADRISKSLKNAQFVVLFYKRIHVASKMMIRFWYICWENRTISSCIEISCLRNKQASK